MIQKTITVTMTITVPEGQEEPDGETVATYLALLLSEGNKAEPGAYTLTDPTVFMEPPDDTIDQVVAEAIDQANEHGYALVDDDMIDTAIEGAAANLDLDLSPEQEEGVRKRIRNGA